jgi:hypothetical protein
MSLPPPPPAPPPGYTPPGYTPAGYGYGYPAAPHTDGMAIAALVCGIAGFVLCAIPSIVGLILGFVSRSRIKKSGGRLSGGGMAMAGIVLGFVVLGLMVAYFVLLAVLAAVGGDTS